MADDPESLIGLLSRRSCWEKFYEYRSSVLGAGDFVKRLRRFIDEEAYAPVCERLSRGEPFPLPRRSVVSKMSSSKKRTVYTYPEPENTVLKLLTWLMIRRYDGIFAPGLYSFRPGRTAKEAVLKLARTPGAEKLYAYKADVSDYFNSIPVEALVPELDTILAPDPALAAFLKGLLLEKRVLDGDRVITERKGVMAGTPVAVFFANVWLRELDRYFYDIGVPYARYSDDIIVFASDPAELEERAGSIRAFIAGRGLKINPDKEDRYSPEEGWVFLGFRYRKGEIDIAPASVAKLKGKMRRKARALARWRKRNALEGEKAAKAFIRVFNRKLFDNPAENELTWARWFFPVITTDASLKELDAYAQDCLRRLISGKNTKARYNVRYEQLKKLGYRSLVHEYHSFN
ncbi:MAG: hypothetical protein K6C36_07860 [Clostridia bacterium]|nr:hypothetical protein [Clostridia bacterium]